MSEDKKQENYSNKEDINSGITGDTLNSGDLRQTYGDEKDPLNLIGKKLLDGNYIITEFIKQGGFSFVYKGKHQFWEESYIFKILKDIYPQKDANTQGKTKKHALKETKKVKELKHQNIIKFENVFHFLGLFCLIEEHIEGKTLNQSLENQEMEKWYRKEENAISIFKQMLKGLSYCHQRGIIHKDLTLNNILITEDKKIKIIDFGLSIQTPTKTMELLQSQSNISLFSRSDLHAGTPLYLSPEQIDYIERLKKGEKIDEESVKTLFNEQIDIWSFGVIAYKLLTGFYPFSGGDNRELFYKIKNEKPKPPKDYNPSIPEGMNNLIMKCLEKDKAKRYKAAEEILEDLKKVEEKLNNPDSSTIDSKKNITDREKEKDWQNVYNRGEKELISYYDNYENH